MPRRRPPAPCRVTGSGRQSLDEAFAGGLTDGPTRDSTLDRRSEHFRALIPISPVQSTLPFRFRNFDQSVAEPCLAPLQQPADC